MPQVTIRTDIDGHEESISEYLCDWPDCPHEGVYVFTVVPAFRLRAIICAQHAAELANRRP